MALFINAYSILKSSIWDHCIAFVKLFNSFVFHFRLEDKTMVLIAHCLSLKVSNGAKIRNRYNQVPHLTQDTNGKVTNLCLNLHNLISGLSFLFC